MRLAAPSIAALLVAASLAAGSSGLIWENATTFRDAAGEDPEAPDITTVRVSNDDEGRIAFRIALSNRPTLRDDMRFSLSIDADHNAHTGLEGMHPVLNLDRGQVMRAVVQGVQHGEALPR